MLCFGFSKDLPLTLHIWPHTFQSPRCYRNNTLTMRAAQEDTQNCLLRVTLKLNRLIPESRVTRNGQTLLLMILKCPILQAVLCRGVTEKPHGVFEFGQDVWNNTSSFSRETFEDPVLSFRYTLRQHGGGVMLSVFRSHNAMWQLGATDETQGCTRWAAGFTVFTPCFQFTGVDELW